MPPKKRPSASDYESDDGFVEDAPRSKKPKNTKTAKPEKPQTSAGETGAENGEVFWELSGKRRVGVQEFKGKVMVNVREYYEKDGQMLPGKKGISLPIDQFNTIISLLPQIEKALTDKGENIGRPDYGGAGPATAADDGEEEPEAKAKAKKNFEETSDEE